MNLYNFLPISHCVNTKQGYFLYRKWLYVLKEIERKVIIKKVGGRFYCPKCDHNYPFLLRWGNPSSANFKFRVIGAIPRRHICPGCLMSDRERLIYVYLLDKLDLIAQFKILHIAPEKSIRELLVSTEPFLYIIGDKVPERYSGEVEYIDITNLKYDSSFFDLIICNHVLEHIIDDKKAFSEIYRVLRSGGLAILQVPYTKLLSVSIENMNIATGPDPWLRIRFFGQKDHVRLYAREDLINRMLESGFDVQSISPIDLTSKQTLINSLRYQPELLLCVK